MKVKYCLPSLGSRPSILYAEDISTYLTSELTIKWKPSQAGSPGSVSVCWYQFVRLTLASASGQVPPQLEHHGQGLTCDGWWSLPSPASVNINLSPAQSARRYLEYFLQVMWWPDHGWWPGLSAGLFIHTRWDSFSAFQFLNKDA